MLYFGPSSLSFTSDNIDSGGEGIYGVWKEWNNKWIKCLIKAPVLNKCANYFCPWLSEICIYVFRLDFWRCWIVVPWRYSMGQIVCLQTTICKFSSWFVVHVQKNVRRVCHYLILYSRARSWYPLSGREEIICVVITAVAADVMFSQVLTLVEKRWKHQGTMKIVVVNSQLNIMKYCRLTERTCIIFDTDLCHWWKAGYEPHKWWASRFCYAL